MIRIGFWGPRDHTENEDPPKTSNASGWPHGRSLSPLHRVSRSGCWTAARTMTSILGWIPDKTTRTRNAINEYEDDNDDDGGHDGDDDNDDGHGYDSKRQWTRSCSGGGRGGGAVALTIDVHLSGYD